MIIISIIDLMNMKPEELRRHYIKTYEELYKYLDRRLRTISPPKTKTYKPILLLKNTLLVKLGTTYNIIENEINNIVKTLEKINEMHSFYKELFKLEVRKDPYELIRLFKRLSRNASIIYREHKMMIRKASEEKEVVKTFRSGLGRLLSIYKRKKKLIEKIKYTIAELSKLPDITGDYIVIITGMPQVGKSTLLSKLTQAKPEISPFPFTTKNVIVGHLKVKPYGKITLIDTPGILDRPIDRKNLIEIRAVLAIKYLANLVLYLFDPNPQSYYKFEEQIRVLDSILEVMKNKEIILVVNKIDITPDKILYEKIKVIENKYRQKTILISALRDINLDKLRDLLIRKFMEKTLSHQ